MKKKSIKIFCLRCRANKKAVNPKIVKTANGKFRVSAKCRSCGSELSSFRQEYIDIVKNNKKR